MLYFPEVGYSLCGDVSMGIHKGTMDDVKSDQQRNLAARVGLHHPWGARGRSLGAKSYQLLGIPQLHLDKSLRYLINSKLPTPSPILKFLSYHHDLNAPLFIFKTLHHSQPYQ